MTMLNNSSGHRLSRDDSTRSLDSVMRRTTRQRRWVGGWAMIGLVVIVLSGLKGLQQYGLSINDAETSSIKEETDSSKNGAPITTTEETSHGISSTDSADKHAIDNVSTRNDTPSAPAKKSPVKQAVNHTHDETAPIVAATIKQSSLEIADDPIHLNDQPFVPPAWLQEYVDYHKSQIKDNNNNIAKGEKLLDTTRWLQWYCNRMDGKLHCGGLADRLKGMMEALMLSIVDRRVVLIEEWEGNSLSGKNPLSDHLEPNLVNWQLEPPHLYDKTNSTTTVTEFATFKDDFGGSKSEAQKIVKKSPCLFQEKKHTGVRFTGNLISAPDLLYTPDCQGKFGEKITGREYTHLFWALFRFSAKTRAIADRLRGPIVPQNRNYYIAAHVRTGNFSGHTDLLRQNTAESWDQFAKCIQLISESLQARCGGDGPPAYVASDNAYAKQYVAKSVTTIHVQTPDTEIMHVDLAEEQEMNNNTTEDQATAAYQSVMGELKVLADSSCLIMSDSGFSKMARVISRQARRCAVRFDKCTDRAKIDKITASVPCPRR